MNWNYQKRVLPPPEAADPVVSVEIGIFDQEEIYRDCTVQVLTNTITGEVSVGWWENEREEDDECPS